MPESTPNVASRKALLPHSFDARSYWEDLRWSGQPVCPYCGRKKIAKLERSWRCRDCDKRFTVTVRTIMESTRIPLEKWMMAIHLTCMHKAGITARDLSAHLGVTMRCAYHLIDRMREGAKHASVRRQQKLALKEALRREPPSLPKKSAPANGNTGMPHRPQRGARFTLWPLDTAAAARALIKLPRSRWLDSN